MNKSIFTKEMKKDYTILIPTMLPIHFDMIVNILKTYGYNVEQLNASDFSTIDYGLKYVHNDICYPAMVVIAQLIEAIESGKYDTRKIALMITQTGGGCRASNYISLLRKALKKAGYEYIPVISISLTLGKLDTMQLKFTPGMLLKVAYAILYADLIMLLKNQCLPYETNKGDTETAVKKISNELAKELSGSKFPSYKSVKNNYNRILSLFSDIPVKRTNKPKVGIVGEIFVKYSPVGNNHLEKFLNNEGAEVVMPGLFDFILYCIANQFLDYELYGMNQKKAKIVKIVYKILLKKQQELIHMIKSTYPEFSPPSCFEETRKLIEGYISPGVKMGEGWLLTAEMLELIHADVKNIICVQPFGCLPNHICGKGMLKTIKERNENVNIVAIDYDSGASRVNQENRIKLMLSNTSKRNKIEKEVSYI